jgi:hyaluronoglucosaminidase
VTVTVHWLAVPPQMGREGLDQIARQTGLNPRSAPPADLAVEVVCSGDPHLTYDPLHRRATDESYVLTSGTTLADPVRVTVSGTRSLRWALVDLSDRASALPWVGGEQLCGPGFAMRGIIEGFYGPPWDDQARLDMIEFAAGKRLNTFLYAPKDDPFLRRHWRRPHAAEWRQRLEALISHCRSLDVDPMVGVSPGLSLRYSDPEDAGLLEEKLIGLVGLGATRVALLLDDIPDRLQHPADIAAFPDLATAQAETANRLGDVLAPTGTTLAVCPTIYWGDGDEEHITRLAGDLDPRIDLFWTGRAVCSPAITAAEAARFARATRRPPLYWDNYPVNDVAMTNEIHIGPYQSRDRDLDRFSSGILANAMEHAEASKIAVSTIADYLWDPAGYDPETSWRVAIERVAGDADAPALALFADTVRASCLSDPEPRGLTNALNRFTFASEFGDLSAARQQLAAFADELGAAADHLLGDAVENQRLQAELMPWLEKFRAGTDAVAVIAAHAGAPTGRSAVAAALDRLRSDPHRVFGDVLEMTLADMTDRKE